MAIDGGDFTDGDDVEFDPIPVVLRWRDRSPEAVEAGETAGEETFYTKPRVPQGVLFAIEAQDPRGIKGLLADALADDDFEVEKKSKEPIPGTSSRERFDALIFHPTREIPGKSLSRILSGLYVEYTTRRNAAGTPPVPTTRPGPSSAPPFRTGRGSTARRSGRASTSRSSQPTGG